MKPVVIALIPALLGTLVATTASAQNAASAPVRGPVPYGEAPVQSRVQQWYSDTGWQPGNSAIQSYGYGYGYGGTGHPPHAVIAPSPEPLQQAYSRDAYYGPTRSMPFGYVVDGFGRYPWQRGAYVQAATYAPAPAPVQSGAHAYAHHDHSGHDARNCPYHPQVAAPVPVLPQPADSGYFAVPERAPVSSTETPYQQEPGERG